MWTATPGLRSLDYMLGIGEKLVFDLADLVKGSCRPADAVYESPVKGLYLLPAPLETEDVVSPRLMKPLIHAFAPYYDHIVIDCPAGFGRGFRGRLRSGPAEELWWRIRIRFVSEILKRRAGCCGKPASRKPAW